MPFLIYISFFLWMLVQKPIRDNPKIFTKSEKIFLKSKKIFQIVMFFGNIIEEFIKCEELLQILIKLLDPQILFCKSQTSLQIQELWVNPESSALTIRLPTIKKRWCLKISFTFIKCSIILCKWHFMFACRLSLNIVYLLQIHQPFPYIRLVLGFVCSTWCFL